MTKRKKHDDDANVMILVQIIKGELKVIPFYADDQNIPDKKYHTKKSNGA